MSLFKNTASQKIRLYAYDYSTGAAKTGDAANLTAYVAKDRGTLTALTDTSATEVSSTNAPGVYEFDVSQAETNADLLDFTGKSSTANVILVPLLNLATRPANFGLLSIDSNGRMKIQSGLQRSVAVEVPFTMKDATGAPLTGSTVTVYKREAGGSFSSAGTATEIGGTEAGTYYISVTVSTAAAMLYMVPSGGSGTGVANAMTLFTDA